MADTLFINGATLSDAGWFNDVNGVTYHPGVGATALDILLNNKANINTTNIFALAQIFSSSVTVNSNVSISGSLSATTKSFVINHPTKPDMKLRYGSLEGPENGVYVRGRLKGEYVIHLPDYWMGLVDEKSITVSLTPHGRPQNIFVAYIGLNKVVVMGDGDINCHYVVFGERKDVPKLEVEYGNPV